ncbi:MAG: competence/damage-inducible protein A [Ruminococcaceae bacterium]|nr:competence/damage-inducible protein A [Oscillospiraceae bacterium]
MSKKYSAEIICVGTELLLGDILNTNTRFLSKELASIGINVYHQSVVGDNYERLADSVRLALSRADIIITSGGLGPTYDDITKETVCEIMGSELVMDEEVKNTIVGFFQRMGRKMTDNNFKQALVPVDGVALHNENGTAPGIMINKNNKLVFMLPGPPRELEALYKAKVYPVLSSLDSGNILFSKNINIFGMGESAVEDALKNIMKTSLNPTVAPYAKDGEVLLRVTASAPDKASAESLADKAISDIASVVGDCIYGIDGESLQNVLVKRFSEKGLTISTAESCTGGLVSKRITEIPGSSSIFGCGICSYSNETKMNVLGVKKETLESFGAVSAQTAEEMAAGVQSLSGSDVSVAITGIAGPDGGTDEKPVGLVYISARYKDKVLTERFVFGRSKNEREYIRFLASSWALAMALKITDSFSPAFHE